MIAPRVKLTKVVRLQVESVEMLQPTKYSVTLYPTTGGFLDITFLVETQYSRDRAGTQGNEIGWYPAGRRGDWAVHLTGWKAAAPG